MLNARNALGQSSLMLACRSGYYSLKEFVHLSRAILQYKILLMPLTNGSAWLPKACKDLAAVWIHLELKDCSPSNKDGLRVQEFCILLLRTWLRIARDLYCSKFVTSNLLFIDTGGLTSLSFYWPMEPILCSWIHSNSRHAFIMLRNLVGETVVLYCLAKVPTCVGHSSCSGIMRSGVVMDASRSKLL